MASPPPALAHSLRGLIAQFRDLPAGELAAMTGDHRAVFVGQAPLRAVAPVAIALGGMPRWHGKRFAAGDRPTRLEGVNLLRPRRGSQLQTTLPMTASIQPSWLDGRPALVVAYGSSARPPWRWVRDEFRRVDDELVLGLTFVLSPKLRALATPFTLVREPAGG